MKIKFLLTYLLLSSIQSVAHAEATEISLFNCVWTIPDNMSITKHENPKTVIILSKENLATTEAVKSVRIKYDKKELTKFINENNIEKTHIGYYNKYFSAFSLHSETHPLINKVAPILYENNDSHALLFGFTEEERLKLTRKCL